MIAQLLHNPKAGDKKHNKKELVKLIEAAGHECRYASTKERGWDNIAPDIDLFIIAGGDGTVRKVAKKFLDRKLGDRQVPLALIPAGTANNIAKTLNIPTEPTAALHLLQEHRLKHIDVGRAEHGQNTVFFMESYGMGLFPCLMNEMSKPGTEVPQNPEEQIKTALKLLYELMKDYAAQEVAITADGKDYSGKYLLVEVMNTSSIGPNLVLAPRALQDDGMFELVLVAEEDRERFAQYLLERIEGKDVSYEYRSIQAKNILLQAQGTFAHTDDELLKVKKEIRINIQMLEHVFMVYSGQQSLVKI